MKTRQDLIEDGILKEHNIGTYQKALKFFDEKNNYVGIVQATGTGKSYLAQQWLYDNVLTQTGKKALILAPLYGILDQFKKEIQKLCSKKNISFENIDFMHYSYLSQLSDKEIKKLHYDYIVVDEFHGLGALGRGTATKKLFSSNPQAKVLGMTATPIRYLDKNRDMGAELFGSAIVQGINLREAIEKKILPEPDYVMAVYSYADSIALIEEKIKRMKDKTIRNKYLKELNQAKKRAETAEGLNDVLRRKITNKNGKFVAFSSNIKQLNALKREMESGMFNGVSSKVKIYTITSMDGRETSNKTIRNFENDEEENCLKILLSIDMFNEGIHIHNIDGCFMFRPTISPRIYLQQIGRVLAFREDENFRPLIFDVVNNIQCLNTIKDIFNGANTNYSGKGYEGAEDKKVFTDLPFKIDGNDLDLNLLLSSLDQAVSYTLASKEQWFAAAERYFKEYGNLDVGEQYVEDETGLALGKWIRPYITRNKDEIQEQDKEVVEYLLKLDPELLCYSAEAKKEFRDKKILRLATQYFALHKNLKIGTTISVKDENGEDFPLGMHIGEIKKYLRGLKNQYYSDFLIEGLQKLDADFATNIIDEKRQKKEKLIVELIKKYFAENGTLKMKKGLTINGFAIQKELSKIKSFVTGTAQEVKYDDWLIEEIRLLDPNFFGETRETAKTEREAKILRCFRKYYEENKNLDIAARDFIDDPLTGERVKIGVILGQIKYYLKNPNKKKITTFSKELISQLEELDGDIFKDCYSQTDGVGVN